MHHHLSSSAAIDAINLLRLLVAGLLVLMST
jgi:hypothetical protein